MRAGRARRTDRSSIPHPAAIVVSDGTRSPGRFIYVEMTNATTFSFEDISASRIALRHSMREERRNWRGDRSGMFSGALCIQSTLHAWRRGITQQQEGVSATTFWLERSICSTGSEDSVRGVGNSPKT